MRGVDAVVQGKKGTGADKVQLAFRCPGDLYKRIEAQSLDGVVTTRVLRGIADAVDMEEAAGPRLREILAQAMLEGKTAGAMAAELALEALDARKKKR